MIRPVPEPEDHPVPKHPAPHHEAQELCSWDKASGISRLKRPNPEPGYLWECPLPASRKPWRTGWSAQLALFMKGSLKGAALGSSPTKPFPREQDQSEA